jgi:hypothetical protein
MSTEESKYYTPSIEEFHVGFEIEVNVEGAWFPIKYMINFKQGEGRPTILDTYNDLKAIRVKYLDKEDILNLGWEVAIEFDNPKMFIQTNNDGDEFQLLFDSLKGEDKSKGIGITIYSDAALNFSGYVKNKFELKKIMQMLCIK